MASHPPAPQGATPSKTPTPRASKTNPNAHGEFGARLRAARERRGLTLREMAENTKISVRALEALERDDIALLPGGIFSRAFVRAYATQVGLDAEQTIAEFMAKFPDDSVTQGHPRTRAKSIVDELEEDARRGRWPSAWVMLAGAATLAAIVYGYVVMNRQPNETPRQQPVVSEPDTNRSRPLTRDESGLTSPDAQSPLPLVVSKHGHGSRPCVVRRTQADASTSSINLASRSSAIEQLL